MEIDPNHWWNSRSTGQKIAGAIAILAGGVSQAFSKSDKNPIVEQITGYIHQDIDAQKDNMSQAWEAYKTAHGMEESDQAYANFRANYIGKQIDLGQQVVADQLKAIAAHSANPIAKNNAMVAVNDLEKERQDRRNQLMLLNMKNAQAQASALHAELLRETLRKQALEDAATKNAQAIELEKAKAEATASNTDKYEREKAELVEANKSTEKSAFITQMQQKAERGEEPSVDDKKAAERIGVALPEGSTATKIFSHTKTKEEIDAAYKEALKAVGKNKHPSYFTPSK